MLDVLGAESKTIINSLQSQLALDVFFNNHNSVCLLLSKDFKIQKINQYACSLFGWSAEKVLERSFIVSCREQDVVCPLFRDQTELKRQQTLTTSVTPLLAADAQLYQVDWRIMPLAETDQAVIGYLLTGTVQPMMTQVQTQAKDNTFAKPLMEPANNALQQLVTHLSESSIGVAWKSIAGVYEDCNERFVLLCGETKAAFIGKNELDLDWGCATEAQWVLQKQSFIEKENNCIEMDISPAWMASSGKSLRLYQIPCFDSTQNLVNILCLLIGQPSVAVKREKESNTQQRAHLQMMAAVDHEVCLGLQSMLQMIKETLNHEDHDSAQMRCALHGLQQHSRLLESMLAIMVDTTWLESGRSQLQPSEADIHGIMMKVTEACARSALLKQVNLSFECAQFTANSFVCYVDAERFESMLYLFMSGLVTFLQYGRITFSLQHEQVPQKNATISIYIQCSGESAEGLAINKLMSNGWKICEDMDQRLYGSLLRLAVARRLLIALGGNVDILNGDVGELMFSLSLPLMERITMPRAEPSTINNNDDLLNSVKAPTTSEEDKLQQNSNRVAYVASRGPYPDRIEAASKSNPYLRPIISTEDMVRLASAARAPHLFDQQTVEEVVSAVRSTDQSTNNLNMLQSTLNGSSNGTNNGSSNGISNGSNGSNGSSNGREKLTANNEKLMLHNEKLTSVLLVEDNKLNQRVMKETLERLYCAVTVASNAAEATDQFKLRKYDIVFMDIGLPDADGFELAFNLRRFEREQGQSHTPFIVVSAHSYYDPRIDVDESMRRSGIDEMHLKPLLTKQADQVLDKWVMDYRPYDQRSHRI